MRTIGKKEPAMNDDAYKKLAKVLDTLPNGFPPTEDGVEIKLLKKIFAPDEAELFCRLRLTFETAAQIAERTGLPREELEQKLPTMSEKGQIWMVELGDMRVFRMLPWVFGIYEFQLPHIDRELAALWEKYSPAFGMQFSAFKPQLMKTVPIEETIPSQQQALPYEKVSALLDKGQSFMVNNCICKKDQGLLGKPCSKPIEICLAIAPIPNAFKNTADGHVITKEEAQGVIRKAEEAGLVHLTWNVQHGHFFICNCCGCCCPMLRGIDELGVPSSQVINSWYYAEIDPDVCAGCGVCANERCQVGAIKETDETYCVVRQRCIGCGLCIGTCPTEAIRLVKKEEKDIEQPPLFEAEWYKERGRNRGVDFSEFE
jgi:Na+-translocating ferredoxin:NAD+ oxidoreductase subunit B